jgi:hypothetical protein
VHLPLLGVDVVLGREQLDLLAGPILERTIGATVAVLREASVDPGALAGLFLVGGSSRMPLVSTMLHRALGLPPIGLDQPELAVAEGSLLAAGLAALPGRVPPPETMPVPAAPTSVPPYLAAATSGPPLSTRPFSAQPLPIQPFSTPPFSTPTPPVPVSVPPTPSPTDWYGVAPGSATAAFPSLDTSPPGDPYAGGGSTAVITLGSAGTPALRASRRPRVALLSVVATVLVLLATAGAAAAMHDAAQQSPQANPAASRQDGLAGLPTLPSWYPSTTPSVPATSPVPSPSPSHSTSPTRKSAPASSRPPSPTATFAAPVHMSGPLQIPQTYLADFDGVSVTSAGADIWFHAVTATERYVAAQGGVTMTYLGKPTNPGATCAAATLSAAPIPVSVFAPGDILCLRTDQGRLSVVRFNAAVGPSPGTMDVTVTTYDA